MTTATPRTTAASLEAAQFAVDVRRDLARSPRQLPSRYFYDTLGSCLFEAICQLPWYRLARAERQLLGERAHRIAALLRDPATIIELGCGNGEKAALLVDAMAGGGRRTDVHVVDVSPWALEVTARRLAGSDHVRVVAHRAPYELGLRRSVAERPVRATTLVTFLGSKVGNYDAAGAAGLLREIRAALRPGDLLLLGADLVKPEEELLIAYDDPLGVTAAFNLNLLARVNRELGANFDLRGFSHQAIWNAPHSRVEMHLVSRLAQEVEVPLADCRVSLAAGETIWTASAYKYEPGSLAKLAAPLGFRSREQWIERNARFALMLFDAE